MLFKSRDFKGVVMNQYGMVMFKGVILEPALRDAVRAEAKAQGWRQVNSSDTDVGLVWEPPAAPDDGMGSE